MPTLLRLAGVALLLSLAACGQEGRGPLDVTSGSPPNGATGVGAKTFTFPASGGPYVGGSGGLSR